MNNNTNKTTEAQGAEVVDREKVGKWLKHDIAVAISILNAIHSDPDLMRLVGDFLYGRIENSRVTQEGLKFEK